MSSSNQVDVFCADASLAAGEPLAGTAAAETSRWLVLEQASAWGPKGVDDSGLPPELSAYLHGLGKACSELRIQLIRRHDREGGAGVNVFLARTGEGLGDLHQLKLPDLSQLPQLGLEAWLRDEGAPEGSREITDPLYLVCAHGKRDRCCALRGMPLYSALRELAPESVWQTTHLGGHRFAATMVVLPHGICYGRLFAGDAAGLHEAHRLREFYDLSRVRGRTCYSGPPQAAEVILRQRLAEPRRDALKLLGVESTPDGQRVRFARNSEEHVVELERIALPAAPASCGAKPKPGEGLVQLRARG
jgi:hypothetical protein